MSNIQLCGDGTSVQLCGDGTSVQLCPEPAPCACPCGDDEDESWDDLYNGVVDECGGLVYEYEIDGYSDGTLASCNDCYDDNNTAWDGTFIALDPCVWSPETTIDVSINGKALGIETRLFLDVYECKWKIQITCNSDLGEAPIWYGEKSVGQAPAGTYTRTWGCDTTVTLTIVESTP